MPDLTRLLEARAALEQQLSRPPTGSDERPKRAAAVRFRLMSRSTEILLWTAAATAVVGLALATQGSQAPAAVTVAQQPAEVANEVANSARAELAARLRAASRGDAAAGASASASLPQLVPASMKLASAGGDTDPSITGAIAGLPPVPPQGAELGAQAPGAPGDDAPGSSDSPAATAGSECTLGFAGLPEVNRAAVATLRLSSSCGPIEKVLVSYGGRTFRMSPTDDRVELDLFAGPEKVDIQDQRGGRVAWTPTKATFQGIAKAVLLWSAPIDLDLKVREYSAREGSDGVLSAAQRGTLAAAAGAGRGFISKIDDGALRSEHVEVYTFLSQAVSPQGEVAFGVEPAASADQLLCAEGKDQRYETYLLVNGVKKERNRSLVGNVGCQVAEATDSGRRLRGFQARLATPF